MQSLFVSYILAKNSIIISFYVEYSFSYAVGVCHYVVICFYKADNLISPCKQPFDYSTCLPNPVTNVHNAVGE